MSYVVIKQETMNILVIPLNANILNNTNRIWYANTVDINSQKYHHKQNKDYMTMVESKTTVSKSILWTWGGAPPRPATVLSVHFVSTEWTESQSWPTGLGVTLDLESL